MRLKAARSGTELQFRPGYLAAAETSSESARERRIDQEIFATGIQAEVPAAVHAEPAPGIERVMLVTVHRDIEKMRFTPSHGARAQQVTLVVAAFDPQGAFVTGKEASRTLALKPTTFRKILADGMNANIKLP